MSNFENLVLEMRQAQIKYNEKPTAANLNYMEDLEDKVDEELNFRKNCNASSYKDVKKFLEANI